MARAPAPSEGGATGDAQPAGVVPTPRRAWWRVGRHLCGDAEKPLKSEAVGTSWRRASREFTVRLARPLGACVLVASAEYPLAGTLLDVT